MRSCDVRESAQLLDDLAAVVAQRVRVMALENGARLFNLLALLHWHNRDPGAPFSLVNELHHCIALI